MYFTLEYACSIKVFRDEEDKVIDMEYCDDIDASGDGEINCICDDYKTLMSEEKEEAYCSTPLDINCTILVQKEDTYLVTANTSYIDIVSKMTDTCNSIKQILVWNVEKSTIGYWVRLPDDVLKIFALKKHGQQYEISILHLDMEIWSGQVVKLIFGECNHCAVMKIKGEIVYPFNTGKIIDALTTTTTTQSTITARTMANTTTGKSSKVNSLAIILPIIILIITAIVLIIILYLLRYTSSCYWNKEKEEKAINSIYTVPQKNTEYGQPDNLEYYTELSEVQTNNYANENIYQNYAEISNMEQLPSGNRQTQDEKIVEESNSYDIVEESNSYDIVEESNTYDIVTPENDYDVVEPPLAFKGDSTADDEHDYWELNSVS